MGGGSTLHFVWGSGMSSVDLCLNTPIGSCGFQDFIETNGSSAKFSLSCSGGLIYSIHFYFQLETRISLQGLST